MPHICWDKQLYEAQYGTYDCYGGVNGQGNEWCSHSYKDNTTSFHYRNHNGSIYHRNPDGSADYDDRRGRSWHQVSETGQYPVPAFNQEADVKEESSDEDDDSGDEDDADKTIVVQVPDGIKMEECDDFIKQEEVADVIVVKKEEEEEVRLERVAAQ
ncbi:hypothetical protein HGRIS_003361 [Hohenbuehelia grisea]|uniref:Uncharacterized protein n=1 Tax=Hohenbuehelia grisea TaxID=104357 RepID=A0ABR3JG40_9AGAR